MNRSPTGRRWLRFRGQVGLSCILLLRAPISSSSTPVLSAQQNPINSKSSSTEDYTDPEAYKIYSALLDAATDSPIVIQAKTSSFDEASPNNLSIKGDSHFRKLWGPVLNDFVAKYRMPMSLKESIPMTATYVLISKEALKSIFEGRSVKGWDAFAERFPHAQGIYSFSPVGFDQGRTRAIVWMNFACGGLCGYGTYHFFEKIGGKWVEVKPKARIPVLVS
jgi:hypothetical protein